MLFIYMKINKKFEKKERIKELTFKELSGRHVRGFYG